MKKKFLVLFAALSVLSWSGEVKAANYGDTETIAVTYDENGNENEEGTVFYLNENWKKNYTLYDDSTTITPNSEKCTNWGNENLNHYRVEFDPNGGENYVVDYMTVTQYCTYAWLPTEDGVYGIGVIREGYHLTGWALDKAGTQMVDKDSFVDEDDTLKDSDGATITLYAQWTEANDSYHTNWADLINNGSRAPVTVNKDGSITTSDGTSNGTSNDTSSKDSSNSDSDSSSATSSTTKASKKAAKQVVSDFVAKNVKGRKIKVSYSKIKGYKYQIQISTKKNFKKNLKKYNTSKTKYTVKKLKKGKTYYVRVRTYKKISGRKVYGKWSSVIKVKIKK